MHRNLSTLSTVFQEKGTRPWGVLFPATNKNPDFASRESKQMPFTSTVMLPEVAVMCTLYNMSFNSATRFLFYELNSIANEFWCPLKSSSREKAIAPILFLFHDTPPATRISPAKKSRRETSFR